MQNHLHPLIYIPNVPQPVSTNLPKSMIPSRKRSNKISLPANARRAKSARRTQQKRPQPAHNLVNAKPYVISVQVIIKVVGGIKPSNRATPDEIRSARATKLACNEYFEKMQADYDAAERAAQSQRWYADAVAELDAAAHARITENDTEYSKWLVSLSDEYYDAKFQEFWINTMEYEKYKSQVRKNLHRMIEDYAKWYSK